MTDRREEILARLLVIAKAVPGVKLAARNKLAPNDNDLPAIIIFDGDETGSDADPVGTRPTNAPRLVIMQPAIEICAGDDPEKVGSVINGFLATLKKNIPTDSVLIGIVLNAKGIHYHGAVSGGVGLGRTQQATMLVSFAFTYVYRPDEL